jgi:hypothetical protein
MIFPLRDVGAVCNQALTDARPASRGDALTGYPKSEKPSREAGFCVVLRGQDLNP